MARVSYKNLYALIVDEIQKRQKFLKTDVYKDQLSRTSIAPLGATYTSALSDVTTAELVTAIQNLLRETLKPTIIEGLNVTATDPVSDSVHISAGKGSVGGQIYELENDVTIKIPFDNTTEVFYINLYLDKIQIDKNKHSDKLTIAKIIVPKPGVTNRVKNNKDDDYPWDAYIVNLRELTLYVDANNRLEEDSLEILRDNIGDILADNLIGNIRLSEDLKITNTAGTLELNSKELILRDENSNILAKFNRNGTYFYDANGIELARFTNIDARVGNILITKNSIQSENFVSGVSGFKIGDDGNVEFNDIVARGTIYATLGEIGGFTITSDKLYGGTIQTSANVGEGENGVVMDSSGLRGYNTTLGLVFNLPTDGSPPTFSNGTIEQSIFEINTNAVIRTSETVGDGSANSAGILINSTGLYGCGANQTLSDANLKALIDGSVRLKGEIVSTQGQIGSVTITEEALSGGLIEGVTLRASLIETASSPPRVRIDSDGMRYELTTDVGVYGGFLYGDGTLYGTGASAYLFNPNYPVLAVMSELSTADIRLYNRSSDPGSGTGPHEVGDLIVVNGVLKICTEAGSPGTFEPVSAASISPGGSDSQLQYNDNGSFGGTVNLTWDDVNNLLFLNNTIPATADLSTVVNKEYVDLAVTSLGAVYYMYDEDDATGYKTCYLNPSSSAETYLEATDLADDDYIAGWISAEGEAPQKLLKGVYDWYITMEKMSGTKILRVYWQLVERKSDSTETVIATSSNSNEIDERATYIVPLQLDEDYILADGSRIVGKLYADVSGTGTAPTLRLYYQGDTSSRWEIPANSEIFQSIFVPYEGAVKDLNLGKAIILGNTTEANSGAIRWTGSDFEGYNGSDWVSLTATKLADITVSSDCTYVDITGLDINTHGAYELICILKNPAGSNSGYHLYVEGDYTITNYYNQWLYANNTTISANKDNNPNIGVGYAGDGSFFAVKIVRDVDGYFRYLSFINRKSGGGIELVIRSGYKTGTVANITQLRISASVTDAIGAGSRIILRRVL